MKIEKIETFGDVSYKKGFLDGISYIRDMKRQNYYVDVGQIFFDVEFYINDCFSEGEIDVPWFKFGFFTACSKYSEIVKYMMSDGNISDDGINKYYYSSILEINEAIMKVNNRKGKNNKNVLNNTVSVGILKLIKNNKCRKDR